MANKNIERMDNEIKKISKKMKPLRKEQLQGLANSLQKIDEGIIKEKIIEQAENMAKILAKGKDCELRKSANGVSVAEVSKKVVSR